MNDNGKRENTHGSKLANPWVAIGGFGIGLLTLLFFMYIVLRDRLVPCDLHFPVISILALGTAMATAFIGGWMTARGSLPIAPHGPNVLRVSAGGGLAVFIVVLGLGARIYTCSDPCPSEKAVDKLVDRDATDIGGFLRGIAENKDSPEWRKMVRSEGLRLANDLEDIAEGRLLQSRQIARREYRAWALLMVARTYLEPSQSQYDDEAERKQEQLFYAKQALGDIDQALAKMGEITDDHKKGDECATRVYRWMTGRSEDLPRTHYLRAVALAAIAQAGGKVTRDDINHELIQLRQYHPVYLETYPNPFLDWAIQPRQQ